MAQLCRVHLILRICKEEFAIIVSRNNDSSQGYWIFRGNDIGEGPLTVWRILREAVFFDMPVQSFQRSSNVLANKSAVVAASYNNVGVGMKNYASTSKNAERTRTGDQEL